MTKVTVKKSAAGRYLVQAKGHATGSTEVCAAVSAILYELAGFLANAQGDMEQVKIYGWKLEDGHVILDFEGGDCIGTAWVMTVIGLRQIEKQYPKFISVKEA